MATDARGAVVTGLALALALAPAVQAQEPAQWKLASGPEGCSLSGQPGDAFVFLAVNPEGGSLVRMHHPAMATQVGAVRPAALAVGTARLAFDARGARTSDGTPGFTAPASPDLRRVLGADGAASVTLGDDPAIALDLTGLAPALAQLEACAAALTPRDPATIAVVKPRPVKFPSIAPGDLPRAGATASEVAFRLTVAPDGKVTACEIVRSSGAEALDTRVCELLRAKSRFEPGRNAAGEAIAATYQSRLTF